jgi:hypothetical protein
VARACFAITIKLCAKSVAKEKIRVASTRDDLLASERIGAECKSLTAGATVGTRCSALKNSTQNPAMSRAAPGLISAQSIDGIGGKADIDHLLLTNLTTEVS